MFLRPPALLIGLSLGLFATLAPAATTPPLGWVTLGTNGGPVIYRERSEPANLLMVDGAPWLVDCGDGAMERLAAAGYQARDISTAFISHLHMDHIGGLQGLIGLRWMTAATTPLTIYGPPALQAVVDGIVASLAPSVEIGQFEPMHGMPLDKMIKVVILQDGADLQIDGVRLRAARNSHFDMPAGHHLDDGSQSLAYRFDAKDYAITYTGDTGPDDAVTKLASGTDLLVSEVIDRDAMDAKLRSNPKLPEAIKKSMAEHFDTQHLSPRAAGQIAATAGARHLVFTHVSVVASILDPNDDAAEKESIERITRQAQEVYSGKVTVANDLDRF